MVGGGEPRLPPQGAVVIPFKNEQFAQFISGLLGQPQSTTNIIPGPFEVDRDKVANLHQLISQRIQGQNKGSLVSFSATIHYDNESSVRINSVDEFISFNEVNSVISDRLLLRWTYLITFPGSQIPEKQDVSINFRSGLYEPAVIEFELGRRSPFFRSAVGVITVRVSYTDRTWGHDIQSLLVSHLENLVVEEPKFRRFTSDHSGWIGLAFGSMFLVSTSTSILTAISRTAHQNDQRIGLALRSTGAGAAVSRKVDLALELLSHGEWTKLAFGMETALIATFIISVAVSIFMSAIFDLKTRSFVLISPKSYQDRDRRIKRLNQNWRHFILSSVLTIALAVLANVITSAGLHIFAS